MPSGLGVNTKDILESEIADSNSTGVELPNTSFIKNMDDGGYSMRVIGSRQDAMTIKADPVNSMIGAFHAAGIFKANEIDLFNNRYRFGIIDMPETIGTVREYLFFTKPDLNIFPRDGDSGLASNDLNPYLATQPFWTDLRDRYPNVLRMLQSSKLPSTGVNNPFNNLLGNMVQSNLDVPALSAEMIDTPENMYGVNYQYRGSSEAGNDSYDFSLEFKDTKYLYVYKFFAAYESYQTLKHHGLLAPWIQYTYDKVLYDQYAIYKILVDDDGETIIYIGKAYGVKSKSLPRDVFSNTTFDNGLSYSIDFNAAFYRDDPNIIYEFNNLSRAYYNSMPYQIDVHNHILDRPDNRPAKAAYIAGLPGDTTYKGYDENDCKRTLAPGGRVLKLKWRGDDQY